MKPVEALNRISVIATAFCQSQVFFAACKLGVFDALDKAAISAEDVAKSVGIHPEGCRRLLAALADMGLVGREDGLYRNSEVGKFCTSASPVKLQSFSAWGNPWYQLWQFLPDALREYAPRWQQALGASANETFAALYSNPAALREFAQFMNAMSVVQALELADHFDFTPFHCVLDVAGGPGGIALELGRRFPHLRGIVMDVAPVCAVAQEYIDSGDLAGRFKTAPADMFMLPYPQGADVIILGHVLHDWGDDSSRKILQNCFETLPTGGTLLVCEKVLNSDFSSTTDTLMKDLTMLVGCESGARERTEVEYRGLVEGAGFSVAEVIRLDAPRDLVVAHKP
jgi:hypothetical protein